jgi:F-type H+-transporting ATPase subunit b
MRFSTLYLPFALLVALAAGAIILPSRIQAQQAAPASNSAEQTPAPPAQPKATESKSEDSGEAQTNAFRLEGPLVKAAAKGLHLSLETTARIFEIFNFLVILLGIGIPLARFIPKLLRKRRDKLSYDIEAARKVTEDAKKRLSAIEAKLARFDEEIAGIRAVVEDESRQDEVRIKSVIEEESARIVASAGSEIDASAAQARRELRNFAAGLAVEQATRQLILTPETDQALINEFLSDAGLKVGNGAESKAAEELKPTERSRRPTRRNHEV